MAGVLERVLQIAGGYFEAGGKAEENRSGHGRSGAADAATLIDTCLAVVSDPDESVRLVAAEALENECDERVIEALLASADKCVRELALYYAELEYSKGTERRLSEAFVCRLADRFLEGPSRTVASAPMSLLGAVARDSPQRALDVFLGHIERRTRDVLGHGHQYLVITERCIKSLGDPARERIKAAFRDLALDRTAYRGDREEAVRYFAEVLGPDETTFELLARLLREQEEWGWLPYNCFKRLKEIATDANRWRGEAVAPAVQARALQVLRDAARDTAVHMGLRNAVAEALRDISKEHV